MTKPKRFVLWAAVSSQPQVEKVSLTDQIRQGHEHAARHGAVVVDELIVTGQSREIILFEDACREIEAYDRLRWHLEQKDFDVFCFLNMTRVGRTITLGMAVIELCVKAGVLCYDIESPPPHLAVPVSTYGDMLIRAIRAVGSSNEMAVLRQRHMAGMIQRVKGGEFPGRIPWGWELYWELDDNRRPVRKVKVDLVAQETIRYAYHLYYHEKMGLHSIAEELNDRGYRPARGGRWEVSTVAWVMNRAWIFAGRVSLNRDSKTARPFTEGKLIWPALITEEEAEQITLERKKRRVMPRIPSRPYRYSGVVWCRRCQKPWTGNIDRSHGKHYPGYRCPVRHLGGRIVETKVTDVIKATIEVYAKRAAKIVDTVDVEPEPEVDTIGQLQQQLDGLIKQRQQVEAAMLRADDAYTDGALSFDRYQRQVDRLQEQDSILAQQIDDLQSYMVALREEGDPAHREQELIDYGMEMLTEPDLRKANAWFRKMLRIWVDPETRGLTVELL